jgi:hypothetical protein
VSKREEADKATPGEKNPPGGQSSFDY